MMSTLDADMSLGYATTVPGTVILENTGAPPPPLLHLFKFFGEG